MSKAPAGHRGQRASKGNVMGIGTLAAAKRAEEDVEHALMSLGASRATEAWRGHVQECYEERLAELNAEVLAVQGCSWELSSAVRALQAAMS
ncbi:MAG: hypothetical protein Q4G30_10575 [Actinomycetaceae bacterium]|nr:hypothetical protein [Actinomycetaceae bacterium]